MKYILIPIALILITLKVNSQSVLIVTNLDIDEDNYSDIVLQGLDFTESIQLYNVEVAGPEWSIKKMIDRDDMYDSYSNNNCLFFVHGYGRTFRDVVNQALQIKDIYGVNVIAYYWPSWAKKGRKLDLRQSKKRIKTLSDGFKQYILIKEKIGNCNMGHNTTFMAHSLGNYFLEVLAEDNNYKLYFNNLILNSAAVNSRGHSEWLKNLSDLTNVYVISNKKDALLRGLQLFSHAKCQLGVKVKRDSVKNVKYFDVTNLIGSQKPAYNSHSYFVGTMPEEYKSIRNMYDALLNGRSYEWND